MHTSGSDGHQNILQRRPSTTLNKELGETAKTVAFHSQTVLLQDVSFKTFYHQSGNICRSSVLAATSPGGRFKWIFGENSNPYQGVGLQQMPPRLGNSMDNIAAARVIFQQINPGELQVVFQEFFSKIQLSKTRWI